MTNSTNQRVGTTGAPPIGRRRPWPRALAVSVLLTAVAMAGEAPAQAVEDNKAKKVKVAYLYNFSRYIEWPESAFVNADAPFVIGVLGDDPFGHRIDLLTKKRYGGKRRIVVKRFAVLADREPCHVLFVPFGMQEEQRLGAIDSTRDAPLLVVCDAGTAADGGPPLRLYLDADGTIGFEINLAEIRRRRLKIDAKMLTLARVVDGASGKPARGATSSSARRDYNVRGR